MKNLLLKFLLLGAVALAAGTAHSWLWHDKVNTSLSELDQQSSSTATPAGGDPHPATTPVTPDSAKTTPTNTTPATSPPDAGTKEPVKPVDGGSPKTGVPAIPNPTPPNPTPSNPVTPAVNAATAKYDITVEAAKALLDKQDGQTFFIDAREPNEFVTGHIPGSMNITPSMMQRGVPQKVIENLKDMPVVVVYCGGGDCHASEDVAIFLKQAVKSIGSLKIMHAGYPAWTAAGHPIETGQDPY